MARGSSPKTSGRRLHLIFFVYSRYCLTVELYGCVPLPCMIYIILLWHKVKVKVPLNNNKPKLGYFTCSQVYSNMMIVVCSWTASRPWRRRRMIWSRWRTRRWNISRWKTTSSPRRTSCFRNTCESPGSWKWGTGIRELVRGLVTLPQGIQEPSVLKRKLEDPQVSLG